MGFRGQGKTKKGDGISADSVAKSSGAKKGCKSRTLPNAAYVGPAKNPLPERKEAPGKM